MASSLDVLKLNDALKLSQWQEINTNVTTYLSQINTNVTTYLSQMDKSSPYMNNSSYRPIVLPLGPGMALLDMRVT